MSTVLSCLSCFVFTAYQLVFPSAIAVGVRVAFSGCQPAHGFRGIRVGFLCKNITAQIIRINPCRPGCIRCCIRLVIDSCQSPYFIICVFCEQGTGIARTVSSCYGVLFKRQNEQSTEWNQQIYGADKWHRPFRGQSIHVQRYSNRV